AQQKSDSRSPLATRTAQLEKFPEHVRIYQAVLNAVSPTVFLGVLQLNIGASTPIDWRILHVFRQHTSMTDTADVEGLCTLSYRRDLHKLLKDAKFLPACADFGETQERACLCLLLHQSGIHLRLETCWCGFWLHQLDSVSDPLYEFLVRKIGHDSTFLETPLAPVPTIFQSPFQSCPF